MHLFNEFGNEIGTSSEVTVCNGIVYHQEVPGANGQGA